MVTAVFRVAVLFWGAALAMAQAPLSSPFTNQSAPVALPYSVREQDGSMWLVRPNGERFFSLGVSCVTMGASADEFDQDNPGYAACHYYPDPKMWAEATMERLEYWGFSTIGAWSDTRFLRQITGKNLAFTPILHLGATAGVPWWDMWDAKIIDRMDQAAREQIPALRDDPRVLGYYADNELGWWNAALFKMTLEQAPASGQRQRLLELLRQTYHNDWSQLLKDFEPEGVGKWQDLEQHGMLFLRPGGKGILTMRRFLGILADRYYYLVREIIRKYDSRALLLGDRYQSFFYPEVAAAAGRYMDVVSSNLNGPWNDGSLDRYYLKTLHEASGKPVLVSEFYMAARQNRSGNQNDHGVYPVVETQKERAAGFRTTLRSFLKLPYVAGADWFQYYDEPTHGRPDGENFNFGLVDIYDRPYQEVAEVPSSLDMAGLRASGRLPRADAFQGVPQAPKNPLGQFTVTLALKEWDRERGFVPTTSTNALADLYICWDKKSIYLGMISQDVVENAFYRNKMVPKNDRALWSTTIAGGGKPIRARIGAGMEPIVDEPTVKIVNLSGLNQDIRNVAALELPAALFGRKQFKTGDTVEFASTLWTHCQAYRVEWRGAFKLSNER